MYDLLVSHSPPQTILVPCTCGYSVKFGDKLSLISTSYEMRGRELQVLNPGLNNAGLTPGKVIADVGLLPGVLCGRETAQWVGAVA